MICRLIATLLILILPPAAVAGETLRLATTTSTRDSGLLDILLPAFEQASGSRIDVFAVGTGAALRMGRQGQVDVLLVHAPEAEKRFVEEGHGSARRQVMHNDFVIVGPLSDPALLSSVHNVIQALGRIWDHQAPFLSRGDDSGTHKKELQLWRLADLDPYGARWYRESGMSMASALLAASEEEAYTLADRGTWLALKDKIKLKIVMQGGPLLRNPYSVIAVSPERHQGIRAAGANAFIDWICSPPAQQRIRNFRKNGQRLFVPSLPTE